MKDKLVIVSSPNREKHYVIRTNEVDELTLIGDVGITGSICGIGNTYEEAEIIYNNFVKLLEKNKGKRQLKQLWIQKKFLLFLGKLEQK